jgi:UDP-glucose 4-epimerase
MKVLVTGGAGYIGSVVVYHLVQAGYEVVVLDDLSAGPARALPPAVRLCRGDIEDRGMLDALLPEVEAVLHFAAFIKVGDSMASPITYFRNNSGKTMALLEAMRRHGVRRFLFSSTAAVYGHPRQSPLGESQPLLPVNPYGLSKAMVEDVLEWEARASELRYASLRYFNAAGGAARPTSANLIPIVLEVAAGKRGEVKIFGRDYSTPDGTAIRDYVHVEDLASAHILALQALQRCSRLVYNVGTGSGHSVLEVVESARRVSRRNIPVRFVARRPGDPAEVVACSSRIRAELGWRPKYSTLDAIVESAWKNYR